jgi:S-adenosylmethionine hydrolase
MSRPALLSWWQGKPMSNIITLTTDFGLQDEYVGVMKGVILSRSPGATIVDLCHFITRQPVTENMYEKIIEFEQWDGQGW